MCSRHRSIVLGQLPLIHGFQHLKSSPNRLLNQLETCET